MASTTVTSIQLADRSEVQSRTVQAPTQLSADRIDDVEEASRAIDARVPEGGYGWMVLASCGVLCFHFIGIPYSWGVYQDALVAANVASPSTLAFIGGVTVSCNALLSILSARLARAIGSRATAIFGICTVATGSILSGFTVNNVAGLFITSGFIQGVGISTCYIVVASVPSQYFSRKRGLANGIVFASGGLGGAVLTYVISALIQGPGIEWTFRIIGFIVLVTGLPAAFLVKDRIKPQRRKFVEWRLFKDIKFVFLFLGGAIGTFPLLVPAFFLPLYSNSIGLSINNGAAILAAYNFSSAVGRIVSGYLADILGSLNVLSFFLALGGISILALWPVSTSIAPLIVFAIINGVAQGAFFSLMPTVAGRVFGSARIAVVTGMLVSGWSGGYLMGAPIAGYLLAAYGGQSAGFEAYRPAMYYAGALSMVSAAFVTLVRLIMSTKLVAKL